MFLKLLIFKVGNVLKFILYIEFLLKRDERYIIKVVILYELIRINVILFY